MNFDVKSLAFERLVAEMLKRDNPNIVINNLDHEKNFSIKNPIFDAYVLESLNLKSFGIDDVNDKIVNIDIKYNIGNSYYSALKRKLFVGSSIIVFTFSEVNEKNLSIYLDNHKILLIDKKKLSRLEPFKSFIKNDDSYLDNDKEIIPDYLPELIGLKGNYSFALGAGCSIDANISGWDTLSKAFAYELLYDLTDKEGTSYQNNLFVNDISNNLFKGYDKNSALDAIVSYYIKEKPLKANNYYKFLKKIIYMSYNGYSDAKTDLLNSISKCISRHKVTEIISYNFDSVLEQNMKDSYRSLGKEVEESRTKINGCIINHVHGYIPYDYKGNYPVENLIFNDKEYYDNSKNEKSFANETQRRIFSTKNVIFVGLSFTDSNMKDILRTIDRANTSNELFAIMKLPDFSFSGKELENVIKKYKIMMQCYFDTLAVKIIWVDDFKKIYEVIDKI